MTHDHVLSVQKTKQPKVSAEPVRDALVDQHPDNHLAFRDLFAMGCILHLQGAEKTGRKLIQEVRHALPSLSSKTFWAELLHALPGNELRFAREIEAHSEVNDLLDLAQRQAVAAIVVSAAEGVPVVTEVRTRGGSVQCPHCSTTVEGWQADPRGREDTCDHCEKPFAIAADATVIFD
jgi:hypothetical protein